MNNTNKGGTKWKLEQYYNICSEIVTLFVEKYFDKFADIYEVGSDIDGVYFVNDYYIDFSSMVDALHLNLKKKDFFAWYEQWIETDETKLRLNMHRFKDLIDGKLKKEDLITNKKDITTNITRIKK